MPADINSVSVTFENGVKREEYGPTKKASVSFTAAVAAGEDGGLVADLLTNLAMAKVAYMLDAPRPVVTAEHRAANEKTAAALEGALADPTPPSRRGRPPKAPPSSEPVQTAPSGEASSSQPAEPAPQTDTPAGDDWGADPAAAEVTDRELLDSCSTAAGRLGGRDQIVKLIQSYATRTEGAPFKVQEIGQAHRRDFLAKLAAL